MLNEQGKREKAGSKMKTFKESGNAATIDESGEIGVEAIITVVFADPVAGIGLSSCSRSSTSMENELADHVDAPTQGVQLVEGQGGEAPGGHQEGEAPGGGREGRR